MNPEIQPQILEALPQVEVTLKLRLAVATDLLKQEAVWNGARYEWKNVPNYGQPYWTRSQFTNQIDNRQFIISEDTDKDELRAYFKQKMIYVPISDLDLKTAN